VFIDKLLAVLSTPDWISPSIAIARDIAPDWESVYVSANGRSPNQCAHDAGPGWKVGYVDYHAGVVQLQRRKIT